MSQSASSSTSIVFSNAPRDRGYVSALSLVIIRRCMLKAHVTSLTITSTYRSEEDQARVMLQNLKPGPGTMYKAAGAAVERVGKQFAAERKAISDGLEKGFDPNRPLPKYTKSKEQVQSEMALKIHQLERHQGVGCVSKHQVDPRIMNVIDVDPNTIHPAGHLVDFIKALTLDSGISRIGLPGGVQAFSDKNFRESVRCLHLEIPQGLPDRSVKPANIA